MTYKKTEETSIIVVKKNGKRDLFDKDKLLKGILRACQKTSVTLETVEEIVNKIERELLNSGNKEVKSELIGELVMNHL